MKDPSWFFKHNLYLSSSLDDKVFAKVYIDGPKIPSSLSTVIEGKKRFH